MTVAPRLIRRSDGTTVTFRPLDGPTANGSVPYMAGTPLSGTWTTIFQDDFPGTTLDTTKWVDREPWQTTPGYQQDTYCWNALPYDSTQLTVASGVLTMKARRASGLPSPDTFTCVSLSTRDKFSLPANATTYSEARLRCPSQTGMLPAFWLLGDGLGSSGWPVCGEVDILEFSNNGVGEGGSAFTSVWYPADVYTSPPGTPGNGVHISHTDSYPKRWNLYDSFHVWGCYRSPTKMEFYIDGVLLVTLLPNVAYNGGLALPPMLFTNAMHLRLSMGVGGGWAGSGLTEAQLEEADYNIDYVRCWQHS